MTLHSERDDGFELDRKYPVSNYAKLQPLVVGSLKVLAVVVHVGRCRNEFSIIGRVSQELIDMLMIHILCGTSKQGCFKDPSSGLVCGC